MVLDLKANEVVIKAGNTNLMTDSEKALGKLVVTNQRIYFKTNNGTSEILDREILPSEIKEVIYFNTKMIFPNGLNIITKKGEELKFTIKQRNSFGELINKMY